MSDPLMTPLEDENEQRTFTFEEVEIVVGEMLREVFIDVYERKFGPLTPEARERLDAAAPLTIKEWISNVSRVARAEDVLVSALERGLVRLAAISAKRKLGIDVGDVGSLAELERVLKDIQAD